MTDFGTDFEKFMKDVASLLDGIYVSDLTQTESRIVKMLVARNVLKISKDQGDPVVELQDK
jgi:hypothetical protein